MRRRFVILLVLIAAACGRTRGASEHALDLLKEVATDVRTRPRVEVLVRLAADEPSDADRDTLQWLERTIENEHVGRLMTSGFAGGVMNLTLEVDSTADAITHLRAILRSRGLLPRASFRVSAGSAAMSVSPADESG